MFVLKTTISKVYVVVDAILANVESDVDCKMLEITWASYVLICNILDNC